MQDALAKVDNLEVKQGSVADLIWVQTEGSWKVEGVRLGQSLPLPRRERGLLPRFFSARRVWRDHRLSGGRDLHGHLPGWRVSLHLMSSPSQTSL